MMFADFKAKIEQINNELFDILSRSQADLNDYNQEIISNAFNNHQNQKEVLKSLENKLYDNENKANDVLNELKSIINNLQIELDTEVANYQKQHVLEEAKTNLFNAKEETLSDFITSKKKKTADLNQKIKVLDNQCLQILKTKNLEISELEKKFKARVQELDRKAKLESEKIAESILAPRPAMKTEAQDIDQLSKDEIAKIRIEGINEIKNVKVKYLSMKKIESLKHYDIVFNMQRDNEILREEYNLQIAKLQYLKNKEQRELQKGLDNYNFEVYHQLNELEKTYALEVNNIKDKFYQQIYHYRDEVYDNLNKKTKEHQVDSHEIFAKIKEIDEELLAKYLELLKATLTFKVNEYNHIQQFFLSTIPLYQENIINLVSKLYEHLQDNAKNYLQYLFTFTYNKPGIQISNHEDDLVKVNDDFIKLQNSTFEQLKKILKDNFHNLLNALNEIANSMQKFFDKQKENYEKYYQSLMELVKKINQETLDKYNEKYLITQEANKTAIEKMKAETAKQINDLDDSNNLIFNNYHQKSESLKQKIKEYNTKFKKEQKIDLSLYNEQIKNIKNNINKIKKKYKKLKQESKKEIGKKFNSDLKIIEAERKTKLKIGQI